MTLYDQIIDEAENIAIMQILIEPSDTEITTAVSEIIGVPIHYNSIGGRLAVASYNRYNLMPLEKEILHNTAA
jgi:hypothetical protein